MSRFLFLDNALDAVLVNGSRIGYAECHSEMKWVAFGPGLHNLGLTCHVDAQVVAQRSRSAPPPVKTGGLMNQRAPPVFRPIFVEYQVDPMAQPQEKFGWCEPRVK